MRSVSSGMLLEAFERGASRSWIDRGFLLLALAEPEAGAAMLENFTVGQRDDRLLALRGMLFGDRLSSVTVCPRCGERLEQSFRASTLRLPAAGPDAAFVASAGGREIRFRAPTLRDLAAVGSSGSAEAFREALARRCIAEPADAGKAPLADWSELTNAMAQELSRVDPQGDLVLRLTCPACAHSWEAIFDIVSFVWGEIRMFAESLLDDVHLLAAAYGWTEAEILALTPARRRAYLDRIQR